MCKLCYFLRMFFVGTKEGNWKVKYQEYVTPAVTYGKFFVILVFNEVLIQRNINE